jgi:hypothetical protein
VTRVGFLERQTSITILSKIRDADAFVADGVALEAKLNKINYIIISKFFKNFSTDETKIAS